MSVGGPKSETKLDVDQFSGTHGWMYLAGMFTICISGWYYDWEQDTITGSGPMTYNQGLVAVLGFHFHSRSSERRIDPP